MDCAVSLLCCLCPLSLFLWDVIFEESSKNRRLRLRSFIDTAISELWRPNTRPNVFPGNLSRCRASHLSFLLITPIHFTGLTCIFCIWNKIHAYNPCCYFYYIGACSDAPLFFGGAMSKPVLIMLGIGVIFALIIIVIAIVDEYLHGHDCWLPIRTRPPLHNPFPLIASTIYRLSVFVDTHHQQARKDKGSYYHRAPTGAVLLTVTSNFRGPPGPLFFSGKLWIQLLLCCSGLSLSMRLLLS